MEYLPLNSFKKNHQPLCLRPKFSTFLMYPAEARIPAYSKSFKLWIQQNFLSTSIDFQNSSAMSSQTKITLYLLLKLSFFNIIRFISGNRFKNIKLDSSSLDIFHKHKVSLKTTLTSSQRDCFWLLLCCYSGSGQWLLFYHNTK